MNIVANYTFLLFRSQSYGNWVLSHKSLYKSKCDHACGLYLLTACEPNPILVCIH